MKSDSFDDKINRFLRAIDIAYKEKGSGFWPESSVYIEKYASSYLATYIYNKFLEDKNKLQKSLRGFPVSLLYLLITDVIIPGLKKAILENKNINQENMDLLLELIFQQIGGKTKSKLFYEDTRFIPRDENVQNLGGKWFKLDGDRRKTTNFSVSLDSFTISLYFYIFAQAGLQRSGPYLDKEGVIIIKEYFDLSPKFWPKSPYGKIKLFLKYSKNTQIRFDILNHPHSTTNLFENLESFIIQIDGQHLCDFSEIERITTEIDLLTQKRVKEVNNLSEKEQILEGIKIYFYIFRSIFEYYHDSYEIPVQILTLLNKGIIKKKNIKPWRAIEALNPKL